VEVGKPVEKGFGKNLGNDIIARQAIYRII